jgi:excinuclease ABC subunit C
MIAIHENNDFVSLLPSNPGVYLFYDKDNRVIYVGKAKNLKNRLSSYFRNSNLGAKTKLMVSRAVNLNYIVVNTESEALLLENTLIKKFKPRYNILLKDDKTYPWIVIRKENFPRVMLTRKVVQDGSEYFGPFTSVYMVRNLLELIKQLYPLRTCNLDLNPDKIKSGFYKPCLDYHIGICKGPCIGEQSFDEYNDNIFHIRNILKGNITEVHQYLKAKMLEASSNYQFELAQDYKLKIDYLQNFHKSSLIVNPNIRNVDVFASARQNDLVVINYLRILHGAIVYTYNSYFQLSADDVFSDIFDSVIVNIRSKFQSDAPEILVPSLPEFMLDGVKYSVPGSGEKRKLLDLSLKNAQTYLTFILNKLSKLNDNEQSIKKYPVLEQLKNDLKLKALPIHIECFDNSNIQGAFPVSSCVVFKYGKPSNKDYRHFHVKTVTGPDDYASMREVVYRRYKRLLDEGSELPQLIVIDGGKGQLNAAVEALRLLQITDKVEIISIAKRLEEIFCPGDELPLYLDKRSSSLRLLQHLRDEAHRFGITFHRKIRNRDSLTSFLDSIDGIGEKTKNLLFSHFGSLENIQAASFDELSSIIGNAKAKLLQNAFSATFEF